jgi:hypothetical protein
VSLVYVQAERLMAAPADVVYGCIANYQQHHRPGGFLPPAFTSLTVERGGVGAGTHIRFTSKMGSLSRTMEAEVTEPEPGRVLQEEGSGVRSVFTVTSEGAGCRVRIESEIEANGLSGLVTRFVAPRMLRPLYADELQRLESYAWRLADRS